jgi:hypothetical protein
MLRITSGRAKKKQLIKKQLLNQGLFFVMRYLAKTRFYHSSWSTLITE